MFTTIEQFVGAWRQQSEGTQKILNALTDKSLEQCVADGHRTLGRIAWHIAMTIPEMMNLVGFEFPGLDQHAPVPKTAREISQAYDRASKMLLDNVTKSWTDATLAKEFDFYGQKWTGAYALGGLMVHEVHHRGQMTVLMRQAGLKVPGVFGPAKEEWATMGMSFPEI